MSNTRSDDPYDLERFRLAQDHEGVYESALEEMRSGHKRSHWMWFVFPQIAGLGQSPMSRQYAISGICEARAYLDDPILGPRLAESAAAAIATASRDPETIFGAIDAAKLRSSMTLFLRASTEPWLFHEVLDQLYGGETDPLTEEILGLTTGEIS